MNAAFHLRCMGYPELTRPDGRVESFRVRKHLALLTYFALEPRSLHRRESLVELLWSRVPMEKGRHSLSTALSVLRGMFGLDAVDASVEIVRFDRSMVALDLDRLVAGRVLGDATTPPLEVDGFLTDFDIADSPAFGHWRERQQARLLPAIQSGLLALADHARRSGDITRLSLFADRLLTVDSLAEEGIRAKMEALALQGDRVSALRLFESWKQEIASQLGAMPGQQIEGVAERLRRKSPGRVKEPAPHETLQERWPDSPFVGRIPEYRSMFEAWEGSTQRETQHVLLTGESGLGKSTLALRFASAASLEGAAVARISCFELEQRLAYGTLGAMVLSLLDRPGAPATAPEWLAELARVVPQVRERFPRLPRPAASEGEAQRIRLADAVLALIEAVIDEQPLVLIVDDYPRSDEPSLAILHRVLRKAIKRQLMVILCGRPPEVGEPALAARLRQAVSDLPLRNIELMPLTEHESEDLLTAVFARTENPPPAPARRALVRAAGGNPMALEILSQDWTNHGEAALALSLPAMRPDVPATPLQAPVYDRLLERLLPELTQRTRLALHLATVLGPRLNDFNAFDLVDLTERQSVAAVEDLVAHRVLRETNGRLEFANELMRARLYLRIPESLRKRLHDAVATRLLMQVRAGEELPGLEVAWHCIRARRTEEGTPFLLSGAREAVVKGEADKAVLALSTSLAHVREPAREDVRILLAEACQELGDWKGSLECLESIPSTPKQAGKDQTFVDVLRIEAQRRLDRFDLHELPQVARNLIATASSANTGRARVHAAVFAASIASLLRRQDLLAEVARVSGTIPKEGLDHCDIGKLSLARGFVCYHKRDFGRGLEVVRAGEQALREGGINDSTYVQILTGLGVFAVAQGQYELAIDSLKNGLIAADRLGNPVLSAQAANSLSLCYKRIGQDDEFLRFAQKAFHECSKRTDGEYSTGWSTANLASALISAGRVREAAELLARMPQYVEATNLPWARQALLFFKADVEWQLGSRIQARRTAKQSLDLGIERIDVGQTGAFSRWTALVYRNKNLIDSTWSQLEALLERRERMDRFDLAELLCAVEHIRSKIGRGLPDYRREARDVLRELPGPCARQIRALGLRLPH